MAQTRRAITVLTAFTLTFALTGCSWGNSETNTPEALGEAEYALCFSAPSSDMDGKHQDGKVVLVEKDGSFSQVPTWGMDQCSLEWTSAGLFFSDMKKDYRFSADGLDSVDSVKTDSQYAMLATEPGTAVGLFNLGFTESGYATQVVTTDGASSSLEVVEGGYFIAAQCEGTVFGIGLATGPYSETGDPDTEPMVLNQLTGTTDGKEKNIGSSTQAREGTVLGDAPCVDGKIYYISDERRSGLGAPSQAVLSIWDTKTGEYESTALHTTQNMEPFISEDGTGLPQVTQHSVKNGTLEWYGVEDSIMSTDLVTGTTERKFAVSGLSDNSASSKAIFTDTEVVILADNNDGSPYRIFRYDRTTGEELQSVVLDVAPEKLSGGFYFRGFALRP